jgi:SH3-like domain-containing protein
LAIAHDAQARPHDAPAHYASLAFNKANMRVGPGTQYPIDWVYVKKGLPLEVLRDYGPWRQVRDRDGVTGWMHRRLLSARRMVIITGAARVTRALRRQPATSAPVVLRAEAGVLGHLVKCAGDWCAVEIAERRGWLPRNQLWGADDD